MNRNADDSLQQSLATLGTEGASAGFTERVLASLAVRRARRRRRQRLAATSVAAVLVVSIALLILESRFFAPTANEMASEAQLLRQEHAQLQSDLEALRVSARETAPVLYLGGDDEMDLVLDLASIIAGSAPAALPTAASETNPYEL